MRAQQDGPALRKVRRSRPAISSRCGRRSSATFRMTRIRCGGVPPCSRRWPGRSSSGCGYWRPTTSGSRRMAGPRGCVHMPRARGVHANIATFHTRLRIGRAHDQWLHQWHNPQTHPRSEGTTTTPCRRGSPTLRSPSAPSAAAASACGIGSTTAASAAESCAPPARRIASPFRHNTSSTRWASWPTTSAPLTCRSSTCPATRMTTLRVQAARRCRRR